MLEDINIMKALPNMKVYCPSDGVQTKWIVKHVSEEEGPCYIRTCRLATNLIYDDNYAFDSNKMIVHGDGTDATIFATGVTVSESLKAQENLAKEGVNVRVVDVFCLKPIDEDTIIKCAKETKRLISVEDHNIIGGLGSIIADVLAEDYPCKLTKMGMKDIFGESGNAMSLLEKYELDSKGIIKEVLACITFGFA